MPLDVSYLKRYGRPPRPLYNFLRKDGTGTNQLVANYSVIPGHFALGPQPGSIWVIERYLIYLEMAGVFTSAKFGSLTALTNGISFKATLDGTVYQLDGGEPVKKNAGWSRHTGVDVSLISWGSGNSAVSARWTLAKSGAPIFLNGSEGDHLECRVTDNLTGVTDFTIKVDGIVHKGNNSPAVIVDGAI